MRISSNLSLNFSLTLVIRLWFVRVLAWFSNDCLMICWWLKWLEQDNMLARIGSHTFGGGWFWGWFWHDLSIRQSSIINSSIINYQSSSINHQSSIINHGSSIITLQHRRKIKMFGNHLKPLETLRKPSEKLRNPWKPSEAFENLQKRVEKKSFGTK